MTNQSGHRLLPTVIFKIGGFVLAAMALFSASVCAATVSMQDVLFEYAGEVLDSNGKPIRDAQVHAIGYFVPGPVGSQSESVRRLGEVARSREDGHFSLSFSIPEGERKQLYSIKILAYKPSLSLGYLSEPLRMGRRLVFRDLRIEMSPESPASIRLFEPDGSPSVQPVVKLKSMIMETGAPVGLPKDLLPFAVKGNSLRLDWLPERWSCQFEVHSGELDQTVLINRKLESHSDFDVQLKPERSLKFSLTPSDRGRKPSDLNAYVRVADVGSEDEKAKYGVSTTRTVVVGNDSEFTVSLVEGKGMLQISTPHAISLVRQALEVGAKTAGELEVPLPTLFQVEGYVRDVDQNPIADCLINRYLPTDDEGRYRLLVAEGQTTGLNVGTPDGYIQPINSYRQVSVKEGQDPEKVIQVEDFVLRKGVPLRGRVFDDEGRPVENAMVIATWQYREGQMITLRSDMAETNEKGEFTILRTRRGVEVGVTALTEEMCSLEEVVTSVEEVEAGKKLEIVMTESGYADFRIRVADVNDKPIEGAEIELRRMSTAPGSSSSFGWSTVQVQTSKKTDKDGLFVLPKPLIRSGVYDLKVKADGFMVADRSPIKPPREGEWVIENIKLQPALRVTGVVVDSSGLPVAGAKVWSFPAINRTTTMSLVRTKTDANGRFSLSGLHFEAGFVFADKGDWAAAELGNESSDPIRLTLEPLGRDSVQTTSYDNPVDEEMAGSLIRHLENMQPRFNSRYDWEVAIKAIIRLGDEGRLKGMLKKTKGHQKATLLAALDAHDDALESCSSIKTAKSRVWALLACADIAAEEAKLQYLTEAAFEISNIDSFTQRLESSSAVLDGLLDLGAEEQAKSLAATLVPGALEVNNEDRNEFSKAYFAKGLARIDFDSAWELIKDSKDSGNRSSGGFVRHAGNIAHEIAAQNPEKTEWLFQQIDSRQRSRYLARIAYRMSQADLDRALKLIHLQESAEAPNRGYAHNNDIANTYSAVALSIQDSDPERAKELFSKAIDVMEFTRRSSTEFKLGLLLLTRAEKVSLELREKVFQQMLGSFANPNVDRVFSTNQNIERILQKGHLLLLLEFMDRYPQVRERLANELFEAFGESGDVVEKLFDELTENELTFAAMALHDPRRTVHWHRDFFEKIPVKKRNYLPKPWAVIAISLSSTKAELAKRLVGDWGGIWVIGKEDL